MHGRGSSERDILGVAAHLPAGPAYAAVRAPIAEGGGPTTDRARDRLRRGPRLSGPLSFTEAGRAVEAVTAAAEIIDCRYDNYRSRLPDVVADNTSDSGE